MAGTELNLFLRHLRSVLQRQEAANTPDADLLRRYVGQGDEAAFAALVQRHGPMVLGVCRRILSNPHDAEDAFQATFLVLVSKAVNLRLHSTLGNWLYGVAYRTAQHARHAAFKRRTKEAAMPTRSEPPEDAWTELLPLLDRELERLPEKYRAAIVLCELQGKPRREAAQLLGCKGEVLAAISAPELREDWEKKKAMVELAHQRVERARKAVEITQAEVKAAEARLEEAVKLLHKYQADADRWDSEVKRLRREAERGIVDPQVVLESENQLKASLASRDAAKASVRKTEAELRSKRAAEAEAGIAVKIADAERTLAEREAKRLAIQVGNLTSIDGSEEVILGSAR